MKYSEDMKSGNQDSASRSRFGSNPQLTSAATTIGLNDDLEFLGHRLHVQTEKMGSPAHCIMTQVFSKGRVVHSTKSDLSSDSLISNDFNAIQDLMRAQHFKVIREISKKKTEIEGAPRRQATP
jgi:hypothetical protein